MDAATPSLLHGQQDRLTAQPSSLNWSRNTVALPNPDPENNAVGLAITKLEDILVTVQESLLGNQELFIPYRTRPTSRRSTAKAGSEARPPRRAFVRFPGRSDNEALKFARVFKILQLSLTALVTGTSLTKRNIYYQSQGLFGKQAVVDNLIDDMAYTLGVGRDVFNIASPILLRTRAACETDASFGDGGKGYPDLNTKQFLHEVHAAKPELPIYALVDYDPDGISIMRCYSHGSRAHAHEKRITVPGLHWLGIKSGDLAGRRDPVFDEGVGDDDDLGLWAEDLQPDTSRNRFDSANPLTTRDRKRAVNMLRDIGENIDGYDMECRRELQVMLFLGIKAEIQAVDDAGDISNWLDEQMRSY
ncbi:meiosis-specific topoisomerase spo11 [Colletotrichum plurivorum]|uniref:DNA topoisomerase (ATP-hydrolyzing) n=1 Tax=Colletotrichum plurivorum TaxID=2175906 RepID=A0A8H6NQC4_9PEZI|nr:meiosis-specific topoisomerase spo11 [Colletotrichum plurivorum]